MSNHDGNLISRNVVVGGRRTSLRMEKELWSAIDDICVKEGMNLHQFCARIEQARVVSSRTSAIRSMVIGYLRLAASKKYCALPYGVSNGERVMRRPRNGSTLFDDSLRLLDGE